MTHLIYENDVHDRILATLNAEDTALLREWKVRERRTDAAAVHLRPLYREEVAMRMATQ